MNTSFSRDYALKRISQVTQSISEMAKLSGSDAEVSFLKGDIGNYRQFCAEAMAYIEAGKILVALGNELKETLA